MTRDRLVSVFVVLAAAAVCTVVVWLAWFRPERSLQTVLVEPTLTPLRDSIREPKRTARKKGSKREAKKVGSRTPQAKIPARTLAKPPTQTGARTSPSPPQRRRTPARKPASSSSPQSSSQPSQTPSQPAPLVTVQTPGRTPSVCTPQIGINC